jgi:putative transcriptional regulator
LSYTSFQTDRRRQLVAAYAAGALDPALALLLDAQATLSPAAARDLAIADTAAGAFLEAQIPAPLDATALDGAFARLAAKAPTRDRTATPLRAPKFADELRALPETVRALALEAAATRGWRYAGRGMRSLKLNTGGEATAEILRIAPGAAAPRHTHNGDEYTLVLCGAFHDERGVYRAGDLAIAGEDLTHRPTAEPDAVCYSLAVTDAPLKFTGALGVLTSLLRH